MKAKALLTLLAAATLGGCGTAREIDDVLGAVLAPPNSQLSGEVVSVDTRNQQIQIRTTDGRTGYITYDSNTKVYYNNQQYNVTSLENGDLVSMTVQTTNNNQAYTDQITVTQSVQDRTGTGTVDNSGLQRLEGSVGVIDRTRGMFELRSGGTTIMVSLTYNATSSVRDRFSRLRSGDYVRLEGRWVGQASLQVERFL